MYCIQAVIATGPVLRELVSALPEARIVPLGQGLSLLPVTDALIALRLGRLAGQSMHSTEIMGGEETEYLACDLLHTILGRVPLSRDQIASLQEHIRQLPPRQPHWRVVDLFDRYSHLFMLTANARMGFKVPDEVRLVAEMPRSTLEKVAKAELRRQLEAQASAPR